jgi:hypothetical protein
MSTNTMDSTDTTEADPEDLDTLYERMMEASRHRQRPTVVQRMRGVRGCDKGRTGSVVSLSVTTEYTSEGERTFVSGVDVQWDDGEETGLWQWEEYAYWTEDI